MWVILDKRTQKYWGPFRSGLDIREFLSRSWPDVPKNTWVDSENDLVKVISLNSPEWMVP